MEAELKNKDNLKAKVQPCLVVVLVGEDPASTFMLDVSKKLNSISKKLPATTNEAELLELVAELNQDKTVQFSANPPCPKAQTKAKFLEL